MAGGVASGLATPPDDWYRSLIKPGWTPPPWLFGPVWTLLYIMIGLAGWLIWRGRRMTGGRLALTLFLLQLGMNFAWTPVFFGLRAPGPALALILLLLATIVATLSAAWPVHRTASILLVPYAGWVAFASALNLEIWRLN